MKPPLFILILFTIFFTSCTKENIKPDKFDPKDKGVIYITKTKVGFNIYSNRGELILEYTKRNCDSLSLETLNDIYETTKEFYNKELLVSYVIDSSTYKNII